MKDKDAMHERWDNLEMTNFEPLLQNAVRTNNSPINLPTFHFLQGADENLYFLRPTAAQVTTISGCIFKSPEAVQVTRSNQHIISYSKSSRNPWIKAFQKFNLLIDYNLCSHFGLLTWNERRPLQMLMLDECPEVDEQVLSKLLTLDIV